MKREYVSSEMMSSRSGRDDWFGFDVNNLLEKCYSCSTKLKERIRFKCMTCEYYMRCEACEKLDDERIAAGLHPVHDKTHVFVKLRPGQ